MVLLLVSWLLLPGQSNVDMEWWSAVGQIVLLIVLLVGLAAGSRIAWWLLALYMGLDLLTFPLFVPGVSASTFGWVLIAIGAAASLFSLVVLCSAPVRGHRRVRRARVARAS